MYTRTVKFESFPVPKIVPGDQTGVDLDLKEDRKFDLKEDRKLDLMVYHKDQYSKVLSILSVKHY